MSEQVIKYDTSSVDTDKKEVGKFTVIANEIVISNQGEFDLAGDYLKNIRSFGKQLEDKKKSITGPLEAAKKAVFALFNPLTEQIEELDKIVSSKRINYFNEQEKKRLAEEERLKKQAQAEEARRKKDLEDQAKKWEEKGNIEKAEERRQQAEQTYFAPKPATTFAPKTKGVAMVDNWKGEVIDLMALVKAVANGKAPITFLEANQTAINKQASSSQDTLQFPGVKFVNKPYERIGGAK